MRLKTKFIFKVLFELAKSKNEVFIDEENELVFICDKNGYPFRMITKNGKLHEITKTCKCNHTERSKNNEQNNG